jgi:hypothetical protein
MKTPGMLDNQRLDFNQKWQKYLSTFESVTPR